MIVKRNSYFFILTIHILLKRFLTPCSTCLDYMGPIFSISSPTQDENHHFGGGGTSPDFTPWITTACVVIHTLYFSAKEMFSLWSTHEGITQFLLQVTPATSTCFSCLEPEQANFSDISILSISHECNFYWRQSNNDRTK